MNNFPEGQSCSCRCVRIDNIRNRKSMSLQYSVAKTHSPDILSRSCLCSVLTERKLKRKSILLLKYLILWIKVKILRIKLVYITYIHSPCGKGINRNLKNILIVTAALSKRLEILQISATSVVAITKSYHSSPFIHKVL